MHALVSVGQMVDQPPSRRSAGHRASHSRPAASPPTPGAADTGSLQRRRVDREPNAAGDRSRGWSPRAPHGSHPGVLIRLDKTLSYRRAPAAAHGIDQYDQPSATPAVATVGTPPAPALSPPGVLVAGRSRARATNIPPPPGSGTTCFLIKPTAVLHRPGYPISPTEW
jgi:hypothetical protein